MTGVQKFQGQMLSARQLFIFLSTTAQSSAQCSFHHFFKVAPGSPSTADLYASPDADYICKDCSVHLRVNPSPSDPDAISGKCLIEDAPWHYFHVTSTSKGEKGRELDAEYVADCCKCYRHIEFTLRLPIIPTSMMKLYSAKPAHKSRTALWLWQRYFQDMITDAERKPIRSENKLFSSLIGGLDGNSQFILREMGYMYDASAQQFVPCDPVNPPKVRHAILEVQFQRWKKEGAPREKDDWPQFESAVSLLCTFLDAKIDGEMGSDKVAYAKSLLDDTSANLYEAIGVTRDATDANIRWAFAELALLNPRGLPDYLNAISELSQKRNSNDLQEFVAMERSKGIPLIGEVNSAYAMLGMTANTSDDMIVAAFTGQATNRPTDEIELREALRIIAFARDSGSISHFLQTGETFDMTGGDATVVLDDPMEVDLKFLPAGIENIGNTCYLNSLLQLYFTIKELRDAIFAFRAPPAKIGSPDPMIVGSSADPLPDASIRESDVIVVEDEDSHAAYSNAVQLPSPPVTGSSPSVIGTNDLTKDVIVVDKEVTASQRKQERQERSHEFVQELSALFASLIWTDRRSIRPSRRVAEVALNNDDLFGQQQDIGESMDNILELLEIAFTSGSAIDAPALSERSNLIKHLFFGKTKQMLNYTDKTGKTHNRRKDEEFSHLIVDVADTLYTSLDAYFGLTKVDLDGVVAEKELSMTIVPPILTIQIQRAKFNRETKKAYKQNDFMKFEKSLRLDRYVVNKEGGPIAPTVDRDHGGESPAKRTRISSPERPGENGSSSSEAVDGSEELEYTLHAVFVHLGEASFGHYYIYIWDDDFSRWLKHNDGDIKEVTETDVLGDTTGSTANAYALIYIRKQAASTLINTYARAPEVRGEYEKNFASLAATVNGRTPGVPDASQFAQIA
ncbi:ubiquitin-specific protease ubp2 [Thoreauomyces humboldtii]|nr:ubiquitin-specific protease ubp2 [Thoreauomyces humboldtii]